MKKKTIQIVSAILLNTNKDLLVVRKRNSLFYMLPGGKIDQGEELIDTLRRELKEELNLTFKADDFVFLGRHETNAANEAETIVQGNIFLLKEPLSANEIPAHAEIEEVCWITKENYSTYQLAHLLKEFALPKWLTDFK